VTIKKASVIMRAITFFTVLSTHVKRNSPRGKSLSKTFHESLKIIVLKRAIKRQILIRIRERDKRIIIIKRSLVHTPHCPLTRPLKTTTYALATRNLKRLTGAFIIERHRPSALAEGLYG